MIKTLNFKYEERSDKVAKENRGMMYRKEHMKNAGFSSGQQMPEGICIVEVLKYRKILPT